MNQALRVALTVILFFTAFLAWAFAEQPTVVDYYRQLPKEFLDGHRYPLEPRGDEWVSRSSVGYEIMPVVDIKNNYLFIEDWDGAGGGTVIHEISVLFPRKGPPLVGVNILSNDGVRVYNGLHFYRLADKEWTRVTEELFPVVDYSPFSDKDIVFDPEMSQYFAVRYSLPSFGTAIQGKIDTSFAKYMVLHGKLPRETRDKLVLLISKISLDRVLINWDYIAGRFRVEKYFSLM